MNNSEHPYNFRYVLRWHDSMITLIGVAKIIDVAVMTTYVTAQTFDVHDMSRPICIHSL